MPGSYSENGVCSSIMRAATAWNVLDRAGVPGITDVWCPPVQTGINVLIRMKQSYRGQAKQAANALWGSSAAHVRYKHVTVVDDDIDIHDYAAVDWAIAHRVNAGENDIVIMPATFGAGLDPSTRRRDRNPDAVRHRQMEPGADRRHHQPRLRPRSGARRRPLPADGLARQGRHRRRPMPAGASSGSASRKAGEARSAVDGFRSSPTNLSASGFELAYAPTNPACTRPETRHDRASRHHSVRGSQARRHRAPSGRHQARRAARRLPGAARLRQQPHILERAAAHQGAQRSRLCDARLRHARLRRERRRARQPDLPRAGRGHPQRADLPGQASRRRSRPHRRHRLELRRRGRGLCRRRRRARRRGHLQRRLGRRRAQVPRPAQEPGGMGALHRHARAKAATTAPRPASP